MATDTQSVDLIDSSVIQPFVRALIFAVLLGASAYVSISIPISPAPITLQVLIVLLAGVYLGPVWGTGSVIMYLFAGGIGLPIFAQGQAGIGALVGNTAGFLWAFPVAALVVGLVIHRGRNLRDPSMTPLPILLGTLLVAVGIIYAGGALYYHWLTEVTIYNAISVMVLPFVIGEAIKIVAVISIVRRDDIEFGI